MGELTKPRAALPRRVPLLALVLALGFSALAAPARADEFQDFELAKSRYDVGNYAEAAERFALLLDPQAAGYLSDPKLRQQARSFHAASLVAVGRTAEADQVIAAILREDPAYQPAAGLFPQEVTDRFIAVRGELRAELEALARAKLEAKQREDQQREQARAAQAARLAALERMAKQERLVRERSRWIAAIPFGVGQFHNDADALGWFFLVSETLTATTSIVSAVVAHDYAAVNCRQVGVTDTGEPAPVDCDELGASFRTARAVNWISFGTTLALVAAGVIEAQASFEPTAEETRERELPPPVEVEPAAAASQSGFWLGLTGWF